MQFTTARGGIDADQTEYDTPWADCTSTVAPNGPVSGVAIFQHPETPAIPIRDGSSGITGSSGPPIRITRRLR